MRMEGKRILQGMIEVYENDFLGGYEGEDKEEIRVIFMELIIQVTRLVNGYRYCSKKECSCSPESSIKKLVNQHRDVIFNKLLGGYHGLSEVPLSMQRAFLREL